MDAGVYRVETVYFSEFHCWLPEVALSEHVRIVRDDALIGEPGTIDIYPRLSELGGRSFINEVNTRKIRQGNICVKFRQAESFENSLDGVAFLGSLLITFPESSFYSGLLVQENSQSPSPQSHTSHWLGRSERAPWVCEESEVELRGVFSWLIEEIRNSEFLEQIFALTRLCERKDFQGESTQALNLRFQVFPALYEQRAIAYKLLETLLEPTGQNDKWERARCAWNDCHDTYVSNEFVEYVRKSRDQVLHAAISQSTVRRLAEAQAALGIQDETYWRYDFTEVPSFLREMFRSRFRRLNSIKLAS